MKQRWTIRILKLTGLGLLTIANASMAEDTTPTVKVGVYARHLASKIVYNYRVINKFPQTIDSVAIGLDSKNDENPDNDTWELAELPSDWHTKLGIPAASSNSPTGWKISVNAPENGEMHAILWEVINDRSPPLLGGSTLAKMSVTLDQPDVTYLTSHATVHFTNRNPATVTVPINQLDVAPPTLEVTLKPNMLHPSDDKLIPVNVTFTVKEDDYDRLPEIKLESITANEPLDPTDIRDASLGIDDRYIKLRAHHNGPFERIYTVIYSATDASGNQTLASATVTVPYEQPENKWPWENRN